jgi:hypothetical protein
MELKPRDTPALLKVISPASDTRAMTYADRRAEERFNADGHVNLSLDEPIPREIVGTLVDYSKNGFRAVHHCSELRTGQLVQFRHIVACGTARVIWNRILPERVETGFLVLPAA